MGRMPSVRQPLVHKWAPSIFLAEDVAYSPSLEGPASFPAATSVLDFLNGFPTAMEEVVGLSLWPTKNLSRALELSVSVRPLIRFSVVTRNTNFRL